MPNHRLSCSTLLAAATLTIAQPAAADPAADIAGAIANPSRPATERARDAARHPAEVLALLDLRPGQHVLDFVAGGGYYTRLLADLVGPAGVVYAHSTEGLLVTDGLQPGWSTLKRDHPNVRLILGIPGRMRLPGGIDRVLTHLSFHDLWWEDATYAIPRMEPDRFLADLYAAMNPGGLVLIVDHRASPGADPRAEAMARHRVDPAIVTAIMQKAGFTPDGESNLLANAQDDHSRLVYDPALRGRTDRFILRFRRP